MRQYLYPGMAPEQVKFYTQHVESLTGFAFSDLRRKALNYFKLWRQFCEHKVSKAEYKRLMVRYLHQQTQSRKSGKSHATP